MLALPLGPRQGVQAGDLLGQAVTHRILKWKEVRRIEQKHSTVRKGDLKPYLR